MSKKSGKKKKEYKLYFALLIVGIIVVLGLFANTKTTRTSLTGNSIAEASYSINTIALEDGADADVIIAASDFASDHYITETMLTEELTGSEQNVLIVQNIGGDTTKITKSGANLLLEGNAEQGFAALSELQSSNYEIFSAYDAVEVVNGQVVGVTLATEESIEETLSEETPSDTGSESLDCTDSDGYDVYTLGHVADSFDDEWYGPREYDDECIVYMSKDGAGYQGRDSCGPNDIRCSVREGYCTDNGYYSIDDIECPYGCENGACISLVSDEAVCGNEIVEGAERCDDGNTENGDDCTAECSIAVKEGCWETDTGVAGTYTGYYYDWDYYYYGGESSSSETYSYDYSYNNYCYYDSYSGVYYYADYYCSQSTYDNKWYASSTWDQCPTGCENAAGCVDAETVEPSCTETDSGKDEDVSGVTTLVNKFGQERTAEDTCYSWYDDYQYVVENYCYKYDGNYYLYTDYIVCDGVCQDGACVAAAYTPACEDTDATEMYEYDWQKSASTLGAVSGNDKSGNSFEKEDYCYDSYGYEYVVEQYCNEKDARYESYVFCPGGCEDGVCVKPTWEQSCKDSDATTTNAGRDIYTAGAASGIDYYGKEFTYADYCYYSSWDKTYYVVDYYCAESSYSGLYASSYWDKCSEGCENGACTGEEITITPTCSQIEGAVSGTDEYGNGYTYYDYCNGAETLVGYSCTGEGIPLATETACNCVDTQCHTASMTVAQFVSSVDNPVIVIGASAATEDNIAAIDLAGAYGWKVVTDATISDATSGVYVAIGGPYANKVSESAFGGQIWDYGPGEALFLVKEYDAVGKTLVISGSEAQDTRNAVALLIKNPETLTDGYVVQRVS